MKMKKTFMAAIVAALGLMSLASCGNKSNANGSDADSICTDTLAADSASCACEDSVATDSCKAEAKSGEKKCDKEKSTLEVCLFHPNKKCETCAAIKKNTKEVIDEQFASEQKSGKIKFTIVDYSKPENKAIADKYEVAWTSIVLIKHCSCGKEKYKNLGKFPIETARVKTPEYRKKLAEYIKEML